ncbi:MAG: phage adaptor protein [Candidatus Thorarchaeota archaeon]|jgi:hypothetical protein
MAFTANDFIVDAADLYGDTGYDRVTITDWIRHLNSAIRATVLVRPDSGSSTEIVQLVSGPRQSKPATAIRLLDITRNMGDDGLTAGKIVTPAKRQHIDYANMLWSAESGDTAIDNFSYDKEAPDVFYVTPPVSTSVDVFVEMVVSKIKTIVTAVGNTVDMNEIFFEPMVQYMLYKAYSADDEGVEFGKALTHLQNFFNLLQVEMTAGHTQGPEQKE